MMPTNLHRTGALLASAALLASLAAATGAGPASAAKPKCADKVATIVGTNKGEVITGTMKADVIVAKGGRDIVYGRGGNDTICGNRGHDKLVGGGGNDLMFGQTGRDKLFGGAGRDRLLGGPADDRLAGGPGNDACRQGVGTGLRVSCERPLPPAQTLVIAYSDLNGDHAFDTGDVMISRIIDTNRDAAVSPGDAIEMGRYPTDLEASVFADWGVKASEVSSVVLAWANVVEVVGTRGGRHTWRRLDFDYYGESFNPSSFSRFQDNTHLDLDDLLSVIISSPGEPLTSVEEVSSPDVVDSRFIDVEIFP